MVCSVPGPDGLQTHFDQLRESKHNWLTHYTHNQTAAAARSNSWSSAAERLVNKELGSDIQPVSERWCFEAMKENSQTEGVWKSLNSLSLMYMSPQLHCYHGDQHPNGSPWVCHWASASVAVATRPQHSAWVYSHHGGFARTSSIQKKKLISSWDFNVYFYWTSI